MTWLLGSDLAGVPPAVGPFDSLRMHLQDKLRQASLEYTRQASLEYIPLESPG